MRGPSMGDAIPFATAPYGVGPQTGVSGGA